MRLWWVSEWKPSARCRGGDGVRIWARRGRTARCALLASPGAVTKGVSTAEHTAQNSLFAARWKAEVEPKSIGMMGTSTHCICACAWWW
jgi:hypothetical protein